MSDLREQLAALAHEQWAGWMTYLFEKSVVGDDGSVEIPADLASRWKRQMNTSYVNLPENEKESDRAEADRMIGVIRLNCTPNSLLQPTGPTVPPADAR